jgi:hypothetical protein
MKLSALLLAGLAAVGCSQGLGDRCQIDTDCESGLVCSLADQTCQSPVSAQSDGGGLPDATPHVDADLTPDAAVPDAAPVDATLADAAAPDAAS